MVLALLKESVTKKKELTLASGVPLPNMWNVREQVGTPA